MDSDNLYTEKESFIVVLDSRNSTAYNNKEMHSSVHFDLADGIRMPKNSIQMTCSVLSFTCPNSLYNVNVNNNWLHVKKIVNSIIIYEFDVYITVGNYNCNTMLTYLISVLQPVYNIIPTYDLFTNKYTFSHDFSSDPQDAHQLCFSGSCGEILGFSEKIFSDFGFIRCPNACNFNGLASFNIHFSNILTKNIDSFTKSVSSIIQSIHVNGQDNKISYIKNSDFNFIINQDVIDDIQIDLKDDLNNFIDLNNQHWNLCLYFSIMKDVDRFRNNEMNGFQNIIKKFGGMYN